MRFGTIPPEPPRIASLDGLAPYFRDAVLNLMAMQQGHCPIHVYESIRTAARQAWLYGFGRDYDDGRGIVTNVQSIWTGWHPHGLAVDFATLMAGAVPQHFWEEMHARASTLGLAPPIHLSAQSIDWPHVQWGHGMRLTPSWRARVLVQTGGVKALWRAVGACPP